MLMVNADGTAVSYQVIQNRRLPAHGEEYL